MVVPGLHPVHAISRNEEADTLLHQKRGHRKYHISPKLQALIGVKIATKTEINRKLWSYDKLKRRQWQRDKRYFYPDETMAPVFGHGRLPCNRMMRYVNGRHVTPLTNDETELLEDSTANVLHQCD